MDIVCIAEGTVNHYRILLWSITLLNKEQQICKVNLSLWAVTLLKFKYIIINFHTSTCFLNFICVCFSIFFKSKIIHFTFSRYKSSSKQHLSSGNPNLMSNKKILNLDSSLSESLDTSISSSFNSNQWVIA